MATAAVSEWQMGVPPLEEAMWEAGLEEVDVYVLMRQNMIAQYIVTQPILYLYEEAVRRSGAWVSKRQW